MADRTSSSFFPTNFSDFLAAMRNLLVPPVEFIDIGFTLETPVHDQLHYADFQKIHL